MWVYTVLDLDLFYKSWNLYNSTEINVAHRYSRPWRICLPIQDFIFFLPVGISTSNSKAGACVCLIAYSYLQCSSSLNGKYMFRIVHYQNNINRMRIHHCYRLSSKKNSYYKDGDLVISPYNAILDSHWDTLWTYVCLGTAHKVPNAPCLWISKQN